MVARLHLMVRDDGGNLQDLSFPVTLESECNLETTGGVIVPKAIEGMIVDTTTLRSSSDIFERWGKGLVLADHDEDPEIIPEKPASKHGKECYGYHGTRPAGARNGEDYCISVSINEAYRTLGIFHRNDLVAELPIRYCPFCGQML